MKRPRVAILGANGQVGSELALLLAASDAVEIRGVVRAAYGAALLRIAGIPHHVADFDDLEGMRRALGDCDLIVDLTYPGGELVDIPNKIENNLRTLMGAMQRGSRYMHMSSIMAFGTPNHATRLRNYRFPRVSYGHIKRWAEGRAAELGRNHSIDTFICRLGQVHGALQGVTQDYRRRAKGGELRLIGAPESLATTIFTDEVAAAVVACARGELDPDKLYTLVSNPQWTLRELGEAYRALYAPDASLTFESPRSQSTNIVRSLAARVPVRDLVETYVFLRSPTLFFRAKGVYRVRAARAAAPRAAIVQTEAVPCLVGAIPGTLVPGLDSALAKTVPKQRELLQRFEQLLETARR